MKKRILSLVLAVILLLGILAFPASAANASDVHNYLKSFAMAGDHYTDYGGVWINGVSMNEDGSIAYVVYYWESDQEIYVNLEVDGNCTLSLTLPASMKLPFTASIYYEPSDSYGEVSVKASYHGDKFTALSNFEGASGDKQTMLSLVNSLLPWLLELTGAFLEDGGLSLKDMGLTGFVHTWNSGEVQVQPTCVNSGVKLYTCTKCGVTKSEILPATGVHTWGETEIIMEPTCTEPGAKRSICSVCGSYSDAQNVAPLGHDWQLTAVTAAPGENVHSGTGRYTCARCGETKEDRLCAGEIFTDMPAEGNWAHDPIDWAYFSGITDGVDDHLFGPAMTCTRAQIVTFLWRAAGEPSVEGAENPFEDVKETDWFYAPVLWAVSEGITDGMTDTTFAPKQNCTRNQVVTFLWRANGKVRPGETENPFTDVPEGSWFYEPVLWALEHAVTDGVSDTLFGAKQNCTRAQVVTFLYRCRNLSAQAPLE